MDRLRVRLACALIGLGVRIMPPGPVMTPEQEEHGRRVIMAARDIIAAQDEAGWPESED